MLIVRKPLIQDILERIINSRDRNEYLSLPDDYFEQALLSFHVIHYCVNNESNLVEMSIGGSFNRMQDSLNTFKKLFLTPLVSYIDEQILDDNYILATLKKYKHMVEWFQRSSVLSLQADDTQNGEKSLAYHLYEYLYDRGIDFTIEPETAVGKPDLVAAQNSEHPLIADTKIFDPSGSRGKNYIAGKGFAQIYTYTRTYNEPVGYLIVYNISDCDLQVNVPEQETSIPCITYNNKTIFILTIDIADRVSASKRGKLKTVEITKDDFTNQIEG